MNYSSIGEKTVTDWFQRMYALTPAPLLKMEEGKGNARGWCCKVVDEPRLRKEAAAAGIRIAGG